jgi:hypothetical protein
LLNPWIETILVIAFAFVGLLIGAGLSGLGRRAGLTTCLLALLAVLALAAMRLIPAEMNHSILLALAAGRVKFALLSFLVPLAFAAVMPYLAYKIERWGAVVLISLSIYAFAVFPFLGSAMAGNVFANLPEYMDSDGVCRQSTSFTCGPAAAATALHQLGLTVSEGQIAVLSRSCPYIGTSDYDLIQAIRQAVSDRPVDCVYGRWNTLPTLTEHQVLLAMLRQGPWTNHCVAVVKATDNAVVFADPAEGLITLSQSYFLNLWTGRGILLQRQ